MNKDDIGLNVKDLKLNHLYYQVGWCAEPTAGLTLSTWVYLGEEPKGWYRFCEWNEFMQLRRANKTSKGAGFFSKTEGNEDWLPGFLSSDQELAPAIQQMLNWK